MTQTINFVNSSSIEIFHLHIVFVKTTFVHEMCFSVVYTSHPDLQMHPVPVDELGRSARQRFQHR